MIIRRNLYLNNSLKDTKLLKTVLHTSTIQKFNKKRYKCIFPPIVIANVEKITLVSWMVNMLIICVKLKLVVNYVTCTTRVDTNLLLRK